MKKIILIFCFLSAFVNAQITQLDQWKTKGNTFTTNTNYLGTNNSRSLVIKTNSVQVGKIDSVGKWTIGTGTVAANTSSLGIVRIKQGSSWIDFGELSSGVYGIWSNKSVNTNTNYLIAQETNGTSSIPTYTNITSLQFGSVSSNSAATVINAGGFNNEIAVNAIGASSVSCGERMFFKTVNNDNQLYVIGNETRIANRKTSGSLVELNGLSGIVEFKTNHGGSGQNAGVLGVSLMTHSATMGTNTLVIGVRGRNEYSGTGTTGGTSAGGWFERALFSNGAVSTSLDYALVSNGYIGILGDGTSVLNTAGIAWRHDAPNSDAKTMYQFRNSVGTMFFNDNANATLFAIGQDHYHSMNMSPSANTELAIQQYSANNNDIIGFYNLAGTRTGDFYTDASGHGAFSVRTSVGTTTINLDGSNGTVTLKHLDGNGTSPTATVAGGAGVSATYTIGTNSSDIAGSVEVTTGTLPNTADNVITFTFNTAYATAPTIILTPANAVTAALSGTNQVYATATTSGFSIISGSVALGTPVIYKWNWIIVQ